MTELEIAPRQARGTDNFADLGGVREKRLRRFSRTPPPRKTTPVAELAEAKLV